MIFTLRNFVTVARFNELFKYIYALSLMNECLPPSTLQNGPRPIEMDGWSEPVTTVTSPASSTDPDGFMFPSSAVQRRHHRAHVQREHESSLRRDKTHFSHGQHLHHL